MNRNNPADAIVGDAILPLYRPLNGKLTHPLSAKAKDKLKELYRSPCPIHEINSGFMCRFRRGGLIEEYEDVSPYATHKGTNTTFARLSADGRLVVEGLK